MTCHEVRESPPTTSSELEHITNYIQCTSMPLLTATIRKQLPGLRSQEHKGHEARAYTKFFTPDANWTWYATEFDGQDTFFRNCSRHLFHLFCREPLIFKAFSLYNVIRVCYVDSVLHESQLYRQIR